MKTLRHRLDRIAIGLVLAALPLMGCEETTAPGQQFVEMVHPLDMHWSFKESGAPYSGGQALFEAQAALRVVWSFRIEGFPTVPDGRHPKFVQSFQNQDRIAFTWNGHNNTGIDDFAPGDSCVATARYPQLDPAHLERATYVFVIGR